MARYAILGPVGLIDGDERTTVGGPRQVALLALLLLNANRAVSSDELIDALWGDLGPEGALKRLQVAIVRLRRTLEAGTVDGGSPLRTVAGGYLLEVQPGDSDAEAFQACAEEGRRALQAGDARRARDLLCEALGMWRGPALADVAYEEFALTEIRRLEELRLAALEGRMEAELRLGEHGGLIAELESLVAAHPGRERFAAQLMLALYRCGRQGDALEVYTRTRDHLSGELGLEPGSELKELQRAILEQDPSLLLEAAPAPKPSRQPRTAPRPIPLPAALRAGVRDPFVAREADLDRLYAAYAKSAAGERQLVMLCGEPGIGKTRLASELATRAHEEGAIVLYGRCDEEALLVQQPFVEALRHYVSACPPHELAAQLGRGGGELRRVVPELADAVPDLPEPLHGDPEGARSRLYEAGCSLLCAASRNAPVVLVLDDLHWADRATLLLLKYVVRYPQEARLLVVGTYRETELTDDHPLCGTLAELRRERLAEHLPLAPLDADAVAQLVGVHAAGASPRLRQEIYEGTEGNAFFVVEVTRHLAETGAIGAEGDRRQGLAARTRDVPEGVRAVVAQRLARLGPQISRLLATAAVIGRTFEFELLEGLSDLGVDELLDALDAAVRARLIEEIPNAIGRHVFAHALIRDTLYDDLTATRRALLHRRVGCALEQADGEERDPRFAELAHHFAQAGSSADIDKAIDYSVRAGEHARSQLAYEQTAVHYRRAVELATNASEQASARLCDLVISQGEAERQAGDPAYRQTLLAAARMARELGEPDRLARAALANSRGYASSAEGIDRDRVAMLRTALAAYDESDSATRAALLALLALELVTDGDWRHRDELTAQAIGMARRVGHPGTLASVLTQCGVARWRPQTVADIQADLLEAEKLASQLGDAHREGLACYLGVHAATETGDLAEADRLVARTGDIAERLGQPFMLWYAAVARAKRCAISGPAEHAERLAFAAMELGQRTSQPDIMLWFLGQLLVARFLRGTMNDGEPSLPDLFTSAEPALPASAEVIPSRSMPLLIGAAASLLLAEVGQHEAARAHYDLLMEELDELPQDYTGLPIAAFASVACTRLVDAAGAARLHALLKPHSSRLVNTGSSWFGAVAHHLGNLAATMNRLDEADAHFDAAHRTYRTLDAKPWLARVRSDRARVPAAARAPRA